MRRSTSTSKEPAEVLTSEEQEQVLQALRDSMASQNRTIRNTFTLVFIFVAAIYAFLIVSFMMDPWSLVHQQRFEFIVGQLMLGYYAIGCCVFGVSAYICKVSSFH